MNAIARQMIHPAMDDCKETSFAVRPGRVVYQECPSTIELAHKFHLWKQWHIEVPERLSINRRQFSANVTGMWDA